MSGPERKGTPRRSRTRARAVDQSTGGETSPGFLGTSRGASEFVRSTESCFARESVLRGEFVYDAATIGRARLRFEVKLG